LLYAKAGLFLSKSLILASLKQFSDAKTAKALCQEKQQKQKSAALGKVGSNFLNLRANSRLGSE